MSVYIGGISPIDPLVLYEKRQRRFLKGVYKVIKAVEAITFVIEGIGAGSGYKNREPFTSAVPSESVSLP